MTNNKLTISDEFLTIEQANELKELGIDFENANCLIWNESEEIIAKSDILGFIGDDYTPTLSVAEMIEMLPRYVEDKRLNIFSVGGKYIVGYLDSDNIIHYQKIFKLLRNSLFEILKWLKQNNLI